MNQLFAIVDLETTGGRADRDRVIEVAVALYDGEKIVDRFESLVHPERSIPYNITRITGITNEMVRESPKFFEVAKQVVEMTENAIFVAHNVRFDYSFLREEYKRLGYTFTRKQLCTVKLSRKAFPEIIGGYSLGNLIKYFDIKVSSRHRAMDDVLATVDVFSRIIKVNHGTDFDNVLKKGIKEALLPPGITIEQLHELPEECGVYYFHDEEGTVVYVGKSINIKKRIFDHFRGKGFKEQKIERHVRGISFEITGSELGALLLESVEIHRLQPIINKAQRGRGTACGIITYQNQSGYWCFKLADLKKSKIRQGACTAVFDKESLARMKMFRLKNRYELCECLLGGGNKKGNSCMYWQIGQCAGAGVSQEPVEAYNERALEAISELSRAYEQDCLLLDKGRTVGEKTVVLIEDGEFRGMGYLEFDDAVQIEDMKSCVKNFDNNSVIPNIIRTYLSSHNDIEMIPLPGKINE